MLDKVEVLQLEEITKIAYSKLLGCNLKIHFQQNNCYCSFSL
jgi:hypothetical protein